jgi:hypothetical protein
MKGYDLNEASLYLKSFDFFCQNPTEFDGATIVKDLVDLNGLDLDAMLHDFQYIHYKAATNFVTKWKSDWMYAKGIERKGKGQYSAFSRFIGLTIGGILFVPYAIYKRGWMDNYSKLNINNDYMLLIKQIKNESTKRN